jgi:GntP family gluconate:H+ symporter
LILNLTHYGIKLVNFKIIMLNSFSLYWPLFVLVLSIVWVVLGITKLKLHPFLTLICASIMVGLLSGPLPEFSVENKGLFHSRVDLPQSFQTDYVLAIKWSLLGFGNTAGGIGLIIALAAIIGSCMMKSGAADRIVRFLLSIFGLKYAGFVLLISGFLLSIPVFFDTVFFLLIPIARAMAVRVGGKYLFFVMAMAGAGAITHSMVLPTPGPLMIADGLGLDLGQALIAGLIASILPACLVLFLSRWFDKRFGFPLREVAGCTEKSLSIIIKKSDEELPSIFLSILPIFLPVFLIASISILKVLNSQGVYLGFISPHSSNFSFSLLSFLGEPNIAMSLAAIASIYILIKQSLKDSCTDNINVTRFLAKHLEEPLSTAGTIILITGAGGAFGGMIRLSGVGQSIENLSTNFNISYVLLAWLVTAIIRIAQGSATVAMITGVGLMSAILIDGAELQYHPLYIFLAIGFGSITLSWMNDSGFWVVQRLSGFTEKETLKTWTVMLTAISLLGLVICLIGSNLIPLK